MSEPLSLEGMGEKRAEVSFAGLPTPEFPETEDDESWSRHRLTFSRAHSNSVANAATGERSCEDFVLSLCFTIGGD